MKIFDPTTHCRCPSCGKTHRRQDKKGSTPLQKQRQQRNTNIVNYYLENHTLEQTGQKFALTRESVRLILKSNNIKPRRTTRRPHKIKQRLTRRDKFYQCFQQGNKHECWIWQKATGTNGYGRFRFNKKTYNAHRLAYYFHYKKAPVNHILHKCNNPSCVNPYHLYDGTPQDNVIDRDLKKKGLNRHNL